LYGGSSRLALGTAQFGLPYGVTNSIGQVASADVAEILTMAERAGISWLDTAAAYGTAEAKLGNTLPRPCPFQIATKTLPKAASVDDIVARAYRSLELLKVEHIGALLVHHAGELSLWGDKLWRSLQTLKESGLVAQIGISAYADDNPLQLATRFQPDLMQLPISIFDQRLVRDGTLGALKKAGVAVHARSIFLQGLVFMEPAKLPATLSHVEARLSQIHRDMQANGISPIRAALTYTMCQPEINHVVIGVTQLNELRQIVDAANAPAERLNWEQFAVDDPVAINPRLW
jgi:aryl-alcohol dehydrogenase-like predicted oxidoreductase